FSDSDVGIDMAPQHGTDRENGWIVEKNDFGPLRNLGMNLAGDTTLERLAGNSFHDVSTPTDIGFGGVGLAVTAGSHAFPVIRLARGNSFFSNDTGLRIHGNTNTTFSTDPKLMSDFGHAGDDGLNTLRCNALSARPASIGEIGVD